MLARHGNEGGSPGAGCRRSAGPAPILPGRCGRNRGVVRVQTREEARPDVAPARAGAGPDTWWRRGSRRRTDPGRAGSRLRRAGTAGVVLPGAVRRLLRTEGGLPPIGFGPR